MRKRRWISRKVKTVRICVSCIKYVKERRKAFLLHYFMGVSCLDPQSQICETGSYLCMALLTFIELEKIHVKET